MFVAPLAVFAPLGAASIRFPQLLGNGWLPLLLALCLAALKPVATAACLGSGAPGGLFTPTLTVGALLGLLSAQAWTMIGPGGPPEAGACALIGAGALLAASTQGPSSAVILLLGLTRRLDSTMIPLMLAIVGALLVVRSLEAAQYTPDGFMLRARQSRTAVASRSRLQREHRNCYMHCWHGGIATWTLSIRTADYSDRWPVNTRSRG
jgi:H+/Cl- antiporter ClcA